MRQLFNSYSSDWIANLPMLFCPSLGGSDSDYVWFIGMIIVALMTVVFVVGFLAYGIIKLVEHNRPKDFLNLNQE